MYSILYIFLQIVDGSGKGWDLFFLSAGNSTGSHLHSKIRLDYENPNHRGGFRFQVQVSDKVSTIAVLFIIK